MIGNRAFPDRMPLPLPAMGILYPLDHRRRCCMAYCFVEQESTSPLHGLTPDWFIERRVRRLGRSSKKRSNAHLASGIEDDRKVGQLVLFWISKIGYLLMNMTYWAGTVQLGSILREAWRPILFAFCQSFRDGLWNAGWAESNRGAEHSDPGLSIKRIMNRVTLRISLFC